MVAKIMMTISLARPIPGQMIMNEVKKITGNQYHEELVSIIDNKAFYEIGRQSSNKPAEDLVIKVGDNLDSTELSSEGLYKRLAVEYKHPELLEELVKEWDMYELLKEIRFFHEHLRANLEQSLARFIKQQSPSPGCH